MEVVNPVKIKNVFTRIGDTDRWVFGSHSLITATAYATAANFWENVPRTNIAIRDTDTGTIIGYISLSTAETYLSNEVRNHYDRYITGLIWATSPVLGDMLNSDFPKNVVFISGRAHHGHIVDALNITKLMGMSIWAEIR